MSEVVLLIPEPGETSFVENLVVLSRAGLLRDFIVARSTKQGTYYTDGEAFDINYWDHLASRPGGLKAVTAIFLHFRSKMDANFRKTMAVAVQDLSKRCGEMGITMRYGTMSIASQGVLLDRDLIEPQWDFNIIGVPEDWTGEGGHIMVPLPEERLEVVALGLVCALTGLWRWCVDTPIGMGLTGEMIPDPPILLCRAASRVVSVGNLTEVLVSRALDPNLEWPVPRGCRPTDSPVELKRKLLERVLEADGFGINLRDPMIEFDDPRTRMGIIETLLLWYRRLIAHMLGRPMEWFEGAKDRLKTWAEDYVQSKTFKSESRIIARYGGRVRLEDLAVEKPTLLDEITVTIPDLPEPVPSPQTWRNFLEFVSCSIDGGTGAGVEFIEHPTEFGERAVFGDRAEVCVLERSKQAPFTCVLHESQETVVIRAYDAMGANRLETAVRELSVPRTEESEEAKSLSQVEEVADRERANLLLRLSAWKNDRKGTLIWQVGEQISGQLAAAIRHAEEVQELVAAVPLEIEEIELEQKKTAKRGKRRARIALALFIVGILLTLLNPVLIPAGVITGLLALFLFGLPYFAALTFVGMWLANAKAQVRAEYRLDEHAAELRRLVAESRHWWSEIWRLEATYSQFLDWAEIAESILCRPYGDVPLIEYSHPSTTARDALSLAFGKATLDTDAVNARQLAMRESVAGAGWLSNVVATHLEEFKSFYQRLVTHVAQRNIDPLADVSTVTAGVELQDIVVYPPRRQLLEYVRSSRSSQVLMAEKIRELNEYLSRSDLQLLIKDVRVRPFVDLGESEHVLSIAEFLGKQREAADLPDFERHLKYRSATQHPEVGDVYWISVGFSPTDRVTQDGRAIPVPTQLPTGHVVMAVTRLEVSAERYRPRDTKLFSLPTSDRVGVTSARRIVEPDDDDDDSDE